MKQCNCDLKATDGFHTRQCKEEQRRQVIVAAIFWAEYQHEDSLADQRTDVRLRIAAREAHERLMSAIERLTEEEGKP